MPRCWIDLYSSDTDKATAFYSRLLGWKAEPADERFGGYFTFTKDGKHVAGCMANDGSTGYPDAWGVHLMTDDIQGIADAAGSHGGVVEMPPMEVAENGSFAMIKDPGGSVIGAWQPNEVKGFEVTREPGTPSSFELHTGAYDDAVSFTARCSVRTCTSRRHCDEFRYTTLGQDEDALAGIMDDPDESSGWNVYFEVSGHRRDARRGDGPRRHDRRARPGHAVRPDGPGQDPTGTAFRLVTSP